MSDPENSSTGARLGACLQLQVPRKPGVLAAAKGRLVGAPLVAGATRLRSTRGPRLLPVSPSHLLAVILEELALRVLAAIGAKAMLAPNQPHRPPAVALLLLHLLRAGVELILAPSRHGGFVTGVQSN